MKLVFVCPCLNCGVNISNLVILIRGLAGPTEDDLTRATGKFLGKDLVFDSQKAQEKLDIFFAHRSLTMLGHE